MTNSDLIWKLVEKLLATKEPKEQNKTDDQIKPKND